MIACTTRAILAVMAVMCLAPEVRIVPILGDKQYVTNQ